MDPEQSKNVIVVGTGLGGLAAALTAHELGMRVVIVEKSPWLGGATAFSAGQAWVGANHVARREGCPIDSVEETLEYARAIASERPELRFDELTEEWILNAPTAAQYFEGIGAVRWKVVSDYPDYYMDEVGAKSRGRYLTIEPFPGAELGPWRELLLDTPNFASGLMYDEIFQWGGLSSKLNWDWGVLEERRAADLLTFGQGLAAHFLNAVRTREIPIHLGERVIELLGSTSDVIGVLTESAEGQHARYGQVILATGAMTWDEQGEMTRNGWPLDEIACGGPLLLTGDGTNLAKSLGASVVDLPPELAPRLPGYQVEPTYREDGGWRQCMEHALPHTFIVNRQGLRFCDDSFHRSLIKHFFDIDAQGNLKNLPMYMIWDESHHEQYGLGATMPGATYPDGLVSSAATLAELARKLGIEEENLVQTTAEFNEGARKGVDPVFGRGTNRSVQMYRGDTSHKPNANLGPIERPPFFGMRIRPMGLAISSSGIDAWLHGQCRTSEGNPIRGLYAVGNCTALTYMGTGYNSGYPLSRAMTMGFLAAHHIKSSEKTE